MYRVTPDVGSTKVNDINNIRPMNFDKEKYKYSNHLFNCLFFLFSFSKIVSPQRNTLDSFVIKKAPKKYFDDPILKDETNQTLSRKRTIDDYMSKDIKPSPKRLKK